MINVITNPVQKLPEINVESISSSEVKNVGEMNIIKIEMIKQAKPQRISINAVKYFEFKSWFFVTGSVWVR